jgi:CRISPR-associated protein Cas2
MKGSTCLVAYDVSEPRRLAAVGRAVKAWKVTGQKSVAECWLTDAQRAGLLGSLEEKMNMETDRLLAFRLDPRSEVRLFGIASRPMQRCFVIS